MQRSNPQYRIPDMMDMRNFWRFVAIIALFPPIKDAVKSIPIIQYPACSHVIFSLLRKFAISNDAANVIKMLTAAEIVKAPGTELAFPDCLIEVRIAPLPFRFILRSWMQK